MKKGGSGLFGITDGDEVDVTAANEAGVRVRVLIDADAQDDQIRVIVVELKQGGKLRDAGRALAPPKVQEHDLAAVVGQVDGSSSVGDGKVGRPLVKLGRMCTSIASWKQSERQQGQAREPTK